MLDPGEMAVAHYLASIRRLQNQSSGVDDQRRDNKMPAIALDVLGTVSELAWFKHRGVFPDMSLRPRRGGADDVLPDGRTVDIKSTWRSAGKLVCKADSRRQAKHDLFVLAVVNESCVEFVGYATGDELICPDTVEDLGHGPSHTLLQRQLHRFRCDVPVNGNAVPLSTW